jgi:hypothetical protein
MEDLQILTKMEELGAYTHNILFQFPKYEKFVLCAQIRSVVDRVIRLIIRAGKKYYKKSTLQDIDIEVEFFRCLIRKAYKLKYINIRRYEVWINHVNEVGRMLGGWICAVKA